MFRKAVPVLFLILLGGCVAPGGWGRRGQSCLRFVVAPVGPPAVSHEVAFGELVKLALTRMAAGR